MQLPISSPMITSHHFYALPLAIIGSEPNLKPWIYNELIQQFTCRVREEEKVDVRLYKRDNEMFKYAPLHEAEIAPKRLVYGDEIVEVYKILLESEQYIYDFIDKYYIKSYGYSHHYIHDQLIYGYDDDLKVFHAYAYQRNRLKKFDIPYDEYIAAYNSEYMQSRLHITVLYRKKEEIFYTDIAKIGLYILDYLEGRNTFSRESLQRVNLYKPKFGLNVYDELKYMFQYDREHYISIDMPNIFCVYDHKRLMNERVRYLSENTILQCPISLQEKFQKVEQMGRILTTLSMKLNQKGVNAKIEFEQALKRIELLKMMEEETYTEYYELNRSVFENT